MLFIRFNRVSVGTHQLAVRITVSLIGPNLVLPIRKD